MPPPAAKSPPKPVSIYDIAEELGYRAVAIHKAIERYGYEPEEVTPGGVRYFSRLIISLLREKMRRHNGSNGKPK
jgi:hypothetical protein